MKRISSKFILIFCLLFTSLIGSVGSALYATGVQEQHIVLTEVLSDYNQLVDRVTRASEFYIELKIYDEKALITRQNEIEEIHQYIKEVDDIHAHLSNLEYPLDDGNYITLEFQGEFKDAFLNSVAMSTKLWDDIEINLLDILDEKMVMNEDLSNIRVKSEVINDEMIMNSEKLILICREAAASSKRISDTIQISTVILSILILFFVIGFSFDGIYKPLMYIKSSFQKMSKGDLSHRFNRKQKDEFTDLFYDFNDFLDSLDTMFDIENKVVKENELENILLVLNAKMKKFIDFETIGLVYKNYQEKCIEITVENEKIVNKECTAYQKFSDSVVINDNNLYIPVYNNSVYLGYYYFTNFDGDIDEKQFVNLIKDKLNMAFYKNVLSKELLSIITETLSDTAEARDPETYNHLVRMSSYSQIVAKRLFDSNLYPDIITNEFIDNIKITAPMHDIGKVSIPDSILLKPGKLTDEEYVVMKSHAKNGWSILTQLDKKMNYYGIDYFLMASTIALHHQEKFDGSGYPYGLEGNEISLEGRIVAIADVFDALTSKRPYKEAFSLEKSYAIIAEGKGNHFDPIVVDAFFEAKDEIEKVYQTYKEI